MVALENQGDMSFSKHGAINKRSATTRRSTSLKATRTIRMSRANSWNYQAYAESLSPFQRIA
jgi:hypothetical protein